MIALGLIAAVVGYVVGRAAHRRWRQKKRARAAIIRLERERYDREAAEFRRMFNARQRSSHRAVMRDLARRRHGRSLLP